MLWVPRKVPAGKGLAPAPQAFGDHTAQRSRQQHPCTGPAPTQAGTSTVNALQLKSYFSKELVLSSFFPGCCGPSRRPHTSRGLSKRQPVGDVLWVSPQCPAPSRGGCQLCRAHGLHRAPDPTWGRELPPLAPCTHLPLPSPSRHCAQQGNREDPRAGLECPSFGKVVWVPFAPAQVYPLPASLISQPAQPNLENTSQFNQKEAWPASGWLLKKWFPSPRGRQEVVPVQLSLARAAPAFQAQEGRGGRRGPASRSTEHPAWSPLSHQAPLSMQERAADPSRNQKRLG